MTESAFTQNCKTILLMIGLIGQATLMAFSQSEEIFRQPILRLETGMHSAEINKIGVDAANRYLVTCSDDRTVRVWELPNRKLIRTIRPPMGQGNIGKMYAVAISPDGGTIAPGGRTGSSAPNSESIYLFDRETGRLLRRLGGLPETIMNLAFSPDGKYLAAMLGNQGCVRLFSTSAYNQTGQEKGNEYGDNSYGVDFDRTGNFFITPDTV